MHAGLLVVLSNPELRVGQVDHGRSWDPLSILNCENVLGIASRGGEVVQEGSVNGRGRAIHV